MVKAKVNQPRDSPRAEYCGWLLWPEDRFRKQGHSTEPPGELGTPLRLRAHPRAAQEEAGPDLSLPKAPLGL